MLKTLGAQIKEFKKKGISVSDVYLSDEDGNHRRPEQEQRSYCWEIRSRLKSHFWMRELTD